MDAPIAFDRLALVLRRPVIWDRDLEYHTRGLKALLKLLLTAGGHAALNRVDGARSDWRDARPDWCAPDGVAACLDALEQHHRALAQDLRAGKRDRLGQIFARRCWLFFDLDCLLAALARVLDPAGWPKGELAPDLGRMEAFLARIYPREVTPQILLDELRRRTESYRQNGRQLHFSFSVDFSVHENLIFSPQLVIWNYWPEDALYSPRRKETDPPLPPLPELPVGEASNTLQLFWNVVETAFAMLSEGFPLRNVEATARLKEEDRGLVFYFVAPPAGRLPDVPQEYFGQRWLPALRTLVDKQLSLRDPLGKEVGTGLVQGQLLTLCNRRPLEQRPHLLLPCCPRPDQPWGEIEREVLSTADSLSAQEIYIAVRSRQLRRELDLWAEKHDRWQWFIREVLHLASDLARTVAASPPRRRPALYRHASLLQQRLLQVGNDLLRHTQDVLALPDQLRQLMDTSGGHLTGSLSLRDLPNMEPLGSTLAAAHRDYAQLKQDIDVADRQARQLEQTYRGELASLTALLEQESREAAAKLEKANFTLTLAVGFLTLVTTLAAVVDVRMTEADLPGFPLWQWATRGLIGLTVVLFVVVLIYLQRRSVLSRGWLGIDELTRKVATLWERIRDAKDLARDDAEAGKSVLDLGGELQKFYQAWEREEQRRKGAEPGPSRRFFPGSGRARELCERAVVLIFLSGLWVDRPYPIPLPRTLALLRWKYPMLDRPKVDRDPDDQEFFRAWQKAGFDRPVAERIKRWCEENHAKMTAQAFFDALDPQALAKQLAAASRADAPA